MHELYELYLRTHTYYFSRKLPSSLVLSTLPRIVRYMYCTCTRFASDWTES